MPMHSFQVWAGDRSCAPDTHIASPDAWWRKIAMDCRANSMRRAAMKKFFTMGVFSVFGVQGFLTTTRVSSFDGKSALCGTRLGISRPSLAPRACRGSTVMRAEGGKVFVSGFLNSKERADQYVFDILQAQGKWEKIVVLSDSVSFAKKRLVSRKSRYSGLLDVLEFEEGDKYDAATMEEKLKGISAWLCFDCAADKIKDSAEFAKKAGVKTMIISSTVSAADAVSTGVEEALKASGVEYTFIRVGEVVDGKEGGSIMVTNATDDLPIEQVVRDDVIRLSAEALMMENVTNTAFSFGKGDDIALGYLKELRQNGTDRRTELSTLISGGFLKYRASKEAEEAEKNKPPPTEEEIAEEEKKFQESREEEYAAIRAQNAIKREEDLMAKAQKEAKEFLEREWNAQFWSRNTSMNLEEYIDDDENWERASKHAWEVMDADRGISRRKVDLEDDDDDDDDDDDGEEDEGGSDKNKQVEDSAETDAAGGSTDIAGKDGGSSTKTKKKVKSDADVTQDIKAESKDEGSEEADPSPTAKLDE